MEKIEVILPTLHLRPYVKEYWFLSTDGVSNDTQRAIPSGCVSLSFKRKGDIFSVEQECFLSNACILGQSTQTKHFRFGAFDLIMILFQPLGAQFFFDVPMSEFKNRNISIGELNDKRIIELEDKLMNFTDNGSCIRCIEHFLNQRLSHSSANFNSSRLSRALDLIYSTEVDVRKLANETCLSYKQFKRLFQEYVGLNPKEYIQIYRFGRVLNILQCNQAIKLSDLADDYSYYDKSHLIKDFKTLSGYSPSEFKTICDPYKASNTLFQSFFINTK